MVHLRRTLSQLLTRMVNLPHFQSVKTLLESIVRDPAITTLLGEVASRVHKINTCALQVIKLHTLWQFEQGQPLTSIDQGFVTTILQVVGDANHKYNPTSDSKIAEKKGIEDFIEQHISDDLPVNLDAKGLGQVLKYSSIEITNQNNSIIKSYTSSVKKLVSLLLHTAKKVKEIKKKNITEKKKKKKTSTMP